MTMFQLNSEETNYTLKVLKLQNKPRVKNNDDPNKRINDVDILVMVIEKEISFFLYKSFESQLS